MLLGQRGPGLARGFTDVGLGNWVLHEGGADSIAAWYRLDGEHQARLDRLAVAFQREHTEALERWRSMRREIQESWDGMQPPARATIQEIGLKYDHPGLELQSALDRAQLRLSAILWLAQRQYAVDAAVTGEVSGRAVRPMRPGYVRRRDH
jgi:hypothetical protein